MSEVSHQRAARHTRPMDRRLHPGQFVPWLAYLGVSDDDDDATRAQKVALTLAASTVTALAVIWVGTYAALGQRGAVKRSSVCRVINVCSVVLRP